MIRSAHCTTTILIKNAVWHVNSTIFLCSYVWKEFGHIKLFETWKPAEKKKKKLHWKNFTHPLLPIAIFQVIDIFVIPKHTYTQQCRRQESILSQNYKVGKEASKCLNHTWKWKQGTDVVSIHQCWFGVGGVTYDNYFWTICLNGIKAQLYYIHVKYNLKKKKTQLCLKEWCFWGSYQSVHRPC